MLYEGFTVLFWEEFQSTGVTTKPSSFLLGRTPENIFSKTYLEPQAGEINSGSSSLKLALLGKKMQFTFFHTFQCLWHFFESNMGTFSFHLEVLQGDPQGIQNCFIIALQMDTYL